LGEQIWVEVCRIGAENESMQMIPQHKEDVDSAAPGPPERQRGPRGGLLIAQAQPPPAEKTLISP
jgi:hypothetical protein